MLLVLQPHYARDVLGVFYDSERFATYCQIQTTAIYQPQLQLNIPDVHRDIRP